MGSGSSTQTPMSMSSAAPTPTKTFSESTKAKGGKQRTKILLLGLKSSGKTSIYHTLFKSMPAKQTLYLETTPRILKHTFDTVIPLEIWDCPPNTTPESLGVSLVEFSSIIFVIDVHNLFQPPIGRLALFCEAAHHENQDLNIEVFLHKTEKNPDDEKAGYLHDIDVRLEDALVGRLEAAWTTTSRNLNIVATSVYDHSLQDQFSKVLQRLIGSLPHLEQLLNSFVAQTAATKAFLFDVNTCLYIATDDSPVDHLTHSLCCDYIQLLQSFGPLYQYQLKEGAMYETRTGTSRVSSRIASPSRSIKQDSAFSDPPYSDINDGADTDSLSTVVAPIPHIAFPSASTSLCPPASETGSPTTLIYHGLTSSLALVALLPTKLLNARRGMLGYNVVWLMEGVQKICEAETELRTF